MYANPGVETPSGEQRPSGLYERGKLFFPKQDFQVDPDDLAFGQERLGITPRRWRWSQPPSPTTACSCSHISSSSSAPGGKVVVRNEPKEVGRVMKPSTAETLTDMMVSAVSAPARPARSPASRSRARPERPRRAWPAGTRRGSSPCSCGERSHCGCSRPREPDRDGRLDGGASCAGDHDKRVERERRSPTCSRGLFRFPARRGLRRPPS